MVHRPRLCGTAEIVETDRTTIPSTLAVLHVVMPGMDAVLSPPRPGRWRYVRNGVNETTGAKRLSRSSVDGENLRKLHSIR